MKYTTWKNAPAGPGFYWFRDLESEMETLARVYIDESPDADPGELLCELIGEAESRFTNALGGEWQGPIVPGE